MANSRKNKVLSLILASGFALTGIGMTTTVQASDDLMIVATSLCEYSKANDRNEIRKTLKRSRMRIRSVYPMVQCDGKSLHAYAKDNGAEDVVAFYEAKVKAEDL